MRNSGQGLVETISTSEALAGRSGKLLQDDYRGIPVLSSYTPVHWGDITYALMAEVDAAILTVHRLHDLGVQLAIDDFGTGYSSLSYLKKFPIDTVKIDRSFIMDIPDSEDDMAISSAVIAMAHRLNMQVVAEGVETKAQLDFLLSHECDSAQGYLFSKPQPLSSIGPMLSPKVRLLHGK